MRLNSRWSNSSQPNSTYSNSASYYQESGEDGQGNFIHLFRKLNEYLEGLFDLAKVDCVTYILPFHNLIVSDKASGPLTSAALSSLSKFVLYGFLNSSFPRVKEGIALLSSCISQCIFEETDWESDELILMKLLELSALCLQCDASSLLSISSAWDIYSTCLSIHSHYRASKILKSEAETALVHLTLTVFSRVNYINSFEFQEELEAHKGAAEDYSNFNIAEQVTCGSNIGLSLLLRKIMSVLSDMLDPNSSLQKQKQKIQGGGKNHGKQALESMRFSLFLVNIALEAGGPALSSLPSLVETLRNDLCRHLLRASQVENLTILSLSLRVVFNLFMSIKEHMKVQLEVFLTSVHLRLLNKPSNGPFVGGFHVSPKEELALESMLEFCREPSLMIDLYTNYDCDVQCTNLFDSIVNTLCVRSIPRGVPHSLITEGSAASSSQRDVSGTSTNNSSTSHSSTNSTAIIHVDILNKLALDGLLSILRSVAIKCFLVVNAEKEPTKVAEESTVKVSESEEKNLQNDAVENSVEKVEASLDHSIPPSPMLLQSPVKAITSLLPILPPQQSSHVQIHYGIKRQQMNPSQRPLAGNYAADSFAAYNPPMFSFPPKMEDPPKSPSESIDQQVDRWCESVDPEFEQDFDSATEAETEEFESDSRSSRRRNTLSLKKPTSEDAPSSPQIFTVNKRQAKGGHLPFTPVQISKELRKESNESIHSLRSNSDFSLSTMSNGANTTTQSTAENAVAVLRSRKIMKQKLKLAAERFNAKPLKVEWVKYAVKIGILDPKQQDSPTHFDQPIDDKPAPQQNDSTSIPEKKKVINPEELLTDAKSVASFLRNTPGLGKSQIGEYISKGPPDLYPFNAAVLREYVNTFDFSGPNSDFDKALRLFLGHFRLPGEAQCIDRLMEAFASRLFAFLGPGKPFESADAAFILSFSTIMLNTDLHNPQIPVNKKMTKEQFIRNNRGINDGKDLPLDYLENLYTEIKSRQIQVDVGINDTAAQFVDYTDSATWNKLIRKGIEDQAPPVFTSAHSHIDESSGLLSIDGNIAHASKLPGNASRILAHERDMFLVMAKPVIETMIVLWEYTNDDLLLAKLAQGVWDFSLACLSFEFMKLYSKFICLVTSRCKDMIQKSRSLSLKVYTRSNALSSKAGFKQLKADTGQDLPSLFLQEDLVDRRPAAVDAAGLYGPPPLNWTDVSLVKSELMAKVLFSVLSNHLSSTSWLLPEDAWISIFRFLLFARSRGALPLRLALIGTEDFKTAEQVKKQSRTGEDYHAIANPSTFAKQRILMAYGGSAGTLSNFNEKNSPKAGFRNVPPIEKTEGFSTAESSTAPSTSGSGSWISNIGGYFWSNNRGGAVNSAAEYDNKEGIPALALLEPTISGNGDGEASRRKAQLYLQLLFSNANACAHLDPRNQRPLRPDDELLLLGLESSKVDILFLNYTELPSAPSRDSSRILNGGTKILSELLSHIWQHNSVVDRINSSSESTNDKSSTLTPDKIYDPTVFSDTDLAEHFPDHLLSSIGPESNRATNADQSDSQNSELSLVVLLEWLSKLALSSANSATNQWTVIFSVLKQVFEDPDRISQQLPYFLERCIIVSINAAIRLIEFLPIDKEDDSNSNHIWENLRLLHGLPSEVVCVLADQLGRGVLSLIKVAHKKSLRMSLEQWYLIFSLLSAATTGVAGRHPVWKSVYYLVRRDLINDMNFTPCRHILLRFFQGVFPGDEPSSGSFSGTYQGSNDENDDGNENYDRQKDVQGGEFCTWRQLSMSFLTRFTLMALAGFYCKNRRIDHLSLDSHIPLAGEEVQNKLSHKEAGVKYYPMIATSTLCNQQQLVRFLLPLAKKYTNPPTHIAAASSSLPSYSELSESFLLLGIVTAESETEEKAVHPLASEIVSMPPIAFSSNEEVEMMWLETVKLLCDFRSIPSSESTNCQLKQLYCIESIFLAGRSSKLPLSLWLRGINEAISRLPINYATQSNAPAEQSSSMHITLSWYSSVLVLDLLVSAIGEVRRSTDFPAVFVRVLSLLAHNALHCWNILHNHSGSSGGAAPASASAALSSQQLQQKQMLSWFFDEMALLLEASLRLLNIPKASIRTSDTAVTSITGKNTGKGSSASDNSTSTSTAGAAPVGYLGSFFNWVGGAAPAAPSAAAPNEGVKSNPVEEVSRVHEGATEIGVAEVSSDWVRVNSNLDRETEGDADRDFELISLSWKTIIAIFPLFANLLRTRNPTLLTDLTHLLEKKSHPENRQDKAKERKNAGSLPLERGTEKDQIQSSQQGHGGANKAQEQQQSLPRSTNRNDSNSSAIKLSTALTV